MFRSSALSTSVDFRSWRFRLVVMWVLMCRRYPRRRFTFPVAVSLKRFAAARLVFIFGIRESPRNASLFGHQHHRHLPSFHPGLLLDLRFRHHHLRDALEHGSPELGMGDGPAAEEHGDLHPVPFAEEVADVPDLEVDVVTARLRAELHFLELAGGVLLARLLLLLLLRILVLAVVHDPADRRCGGGRDLDQIELLPVRDPLGVHGRHHPELLSVAVDDPDLAGADMLVDADSLLDFRYDTPPGMRASARVRATNASRASAPRFSPPMRGATVPSAASRSPTTASTGIFSSWASRIFRLSFSLRRSPSARSPAPRQACTTWRA